ncbi:7 transmembrane receptor [Ancylostoma ceylanicum]|uniref:7 transmembrane receptor n=1 Tax=Ancylostoma ceylanicum TaxID=53326 RepID=A0A0D6LJ42_9BILA|nr:7 transmembrane receptor [Ancylostoma ceylanicum]
MFPQSYACKHVLTINDRIVGLLGARNLFEHKDAGEGYMTHKPSGYQAVWNNLSRRMIRSNCVALLVLLICSLLAFILLLPVLIQSSVYKIDRMTMMPLQDDTDEQRSSDLHGTTSSKCVFDSDAMFTLYTFMIGFAFPAILITMFYSRVICKVQQSSRNMRGMRTIPEQGKRDISAHRVQQVTKRIVAVILFYFLCWTPQWTLNIMTQFNLIHVSWMTPALSAMFFVAHLLVCFNSAANPVLYALINRELRQQHVMAMARKRQSFTHATHGALEFVARHTHNLKPYKAVRQVPCSNVDSFGYDTLTNFAKSTEGIFRCCERRIAGDKTEYTMAAHDQEGRFGDGLVLSTAPVPKPTQPGFSHFIDYRCDSKGGANHLIRNFVFQRHTH